LGGACKPASLAWRDPWGGNYFGSSPVLKQTLGQPMKPIAILGVILIVLGVAGLFASHISWTQTKPVAQLGPLKINSEQEHTVWIPTAAGVVSVLAGLALVFVGKRSA
jgi:uncharacterized membrane protein HdeD (DUF308 family)